MRALLVHNPTAGTKGHDRDSITDALHLADIKVDYVSTKDAHLKRALDETYELVVAAGGDGTIAFVFTHLPDRAVPIGILPLGSANNIARSLGIAGTPAELAEQWRNGRVQPFHLTQIKYQDEETGLCAEGFGVGLIAALIKRRAKGKQADGPDDIRRGRLAFVDIVGEAKPLDLEVNIDGRPWNSDLISVDILNIPFTGPALPLAYEADPGDTILDVVGFEKERREELSRWIKSPQRHPPPATLQRGKNISIRWRAADSRLDDQLIAATPGWRQASLRCDSRALNILAPTKHPATTKSAKT